MVVEEVCAFAVVNQKSSVSFIQCQASCNSLKMVYFATDLGLYSFTTRHNFMSLSSFKHVSVCVSPKIVKAFKQYYLNHSQIYYNVIRFCFEIFPHTYMVVLMLLTRLQGAGVTPGIALRVL